MNKYSHIQEDQLSKIDRLGLAYCRLACWEWDSYIGEKPLGFDEMPDYHREKRECGSSLFLREYFPYLFPKQEPVLTKHDFVTPVIEAIKETIGEENVSRCWWVFELGRTEEEWQEWYYHKRLQDNTRRQLILIKRYKAGGGYEERVYRIGGHS